MPITADAEVNAFAVGQDLGHQEQGPIQVLSGGNRRAVDTAAHLARGVADAGGRVIGPAIAFALRNPDLYVAGTRVEMVSSPEALAAQVDGLSAKDVDALDFFPEFMESADRIGWWLAHESPPGERAEAVAARARSFAVSLVDAVPGLPEVVVAITHSPVVRAVGLDFLGRDLGEPPWVSGLVVSIGSDRRMSVAGFGIDGL